MIDEAADGSIDARNLLGLDGSAMPCRPEKRLMLAILELAVSDFQKYGTASHGRGRRLFVEADAWFRSTSTDALFDFERICQALALDPSCIRSGLDRWRAARRREAVRTVVHFPFRRMAGSRHTIAIAS